MIAHVLRFTSLLLLVLAPSMAATHDDTNFDITAMEAEQDSFEAMDDNHRNLRRRRSYRFKLKVTNLITTNSWSSCTPWPLPPTLSVSPTPTLVGLPYS